MAVREAEDGRFVLDREGWVPKFPIEPPERGDRWRVAVLLQRVDQPVDVVGAQTEATGPSAFSESALST